MLRRFLDETDLWDWLRPRRSVRSVADDADAQLERYATLMARTVGSGGDRSPARR